MSTPELGFDPALERLPVIADPEAVARLFAPLAGPLAVGALRRQDTKYQPGSGCVATYELSLAEPGQPARRTFGVVSVTPEGASARLLQVDGDPGLPALAEALDPARMAERFAAASPAGAVSACDAVAVRYKPGARCVIRYTLRGAAGPLELYGKLLAGGIDGQLGTIGALRAAADPAMPAILPVSAAWPDLGLLVQPAVERAAELNERAFDPALPAERREGWLRAAGRCLAAVHGCALPAAPARSHRDDLAELRAYLGPLGQADAALAGAYAAVLERLDRAAPSEREERLGAGHGALRTDQFLLTGDGGERLVLIDLDTACQAEPARDLGNLLAYLDWKAIRRPGSADLIRRAGEVFLAGYTDHGGAPAAGRLARHRAASLLKIAGRRYRSLTIGEWPLVPGLVELAGELTP